MSSSSVKVLAIGDLHFQAKNLEVYRDVTERLVECAQSNNPDFIVLLGDLLHTHEKIHVEPLNLITDLVIRLSKIAPTFVIVGNHDYCNNQQFLTQKHPFNSFKEFENVVIVDHVVDHEIRSHKFIFCPYVAPGRFEEALNTGDCEWKDANCIFAHQEFYGCNFNPTTTSEVGDKWDDKHPFVVSGHIHNEQRLQENIYYTGSCMQHAFGESADKTIALLTFGDKTTAIPTITRINLNIRKKIIKYVDVNDIKTLNIKETYSTNTEFKIVISGNSAQIKTFRKSKKFEKLSSMYTVSFKICTDETVSSKLNESRVTHKFHEVLKDLIKPNKQAVDAYNSLNDESGSYLQTNKYK